MVARASREAAENFAFVWCDRAKEGLAYRTTCEGIAEEQDLPVELLEAGTFGACKEALCIAQRHVCAGFLLQEMARTPTQRVIDESDMEGISVFSPEDFGLTQAELESIRPKLFDGATTAVRFQPLAGPARASALRGALHQFQKASRVVHLMRTVDTSGSTCLGTFISADLSGAQEPPPVTMPYDDGQAVTWTDLYYEAFLDSAFEYSNTLPRTLQATRSAGDGYMAGRAPVSDEIATRWNGEHDSVAAAARLLGAGDSVVRAGIEPYDLSIKCTGGVSFAGNMRVNQVPVCPALGTKAGVRRSVDVVRQMRLSPSSPDLAQDVVDAHNARLMDLGEISEPLPRSVVFSQLEVTEADLELANTYLCAEANAFGKVFTEAPDGTVYGTQEPVRPPPPEAVAAHFLGAMDTGVEVSVLDGAYASGGAVRTLDQMKITAAALDDAAVADVVHPALYRAVQDLGLSLQASVGRYRLEFLIGGSVGGNAADRVTVRIHGISTGVDGPRDEFWAVHGIGALKCALQGNVDGAPCERGAYIVNLSSDGSIEPLGSEMVDLKGAVLSHTIEQMSRYPDGEAPGPVGVDDGVYVLRVSGDELETLGGVVPTPGNDEVGDGYTRQVIMPAGGLFEKTIGTMLTPMPDDCSKPRTSCAGLPASLWPPLESEILGNQDYNRPYESSFAHYMAMAKEAALEADRLGIDLLQSGLELDARAEEANEELIALCGPDANGDTGCELGEEIPWATLGDRQACMWRVGGELCACPVDTGGAPCPVHCPIQVPEGTPTFGQDDVAKLEAVCAEVLDEVLAGYTLVSTVEWVPVLHTLGLGESTDENREHKCKVFTKLRRPQLTKEKRDELIYTELAPMFHKDEIRRIASLMVYREEFYDNYRLEFDGKPVFSTLRPYRPCDNSIVPPPCTIPGDDSITGSDFWEREIGCFVSAPSTCSPNNGIGQDGCPNAYTDNTQHLSMDTEPEALRARWAWGFGHLRRSMATLGVISGELSGMMELARIHYAAEGVDTIPYSVKRHKLRGPCKAIIDDDETPRWVAECKPWNRSDYERKHCVLLPREDMDTLPKLIGRPVNRNAYIPDRIPLHRDYDAYWALPIGEPVDYGDPVPFPLFGVDPQFVFCHMPPPHKRGCAYGLGASADPWELDQWANPSTCASGYPIHHGRSTGYIGASGAGPAAVKTMNAYKDARDEMWQSPPPDLCSNPQGDRTAHAIWRSFCVAPSDIDEEDELFRSKGKVPGEDEDRNEVYFNRKTVGSWFKPTFGDSGGVYWAQYLYDQTDHPVADHEHRRFQYPVTARNVFDAMELACHASSVRRQHAMDCKMLTPEQVTSESWTPEEMVGLLDCYRDWMRQVAGSVVVGPLPSNVVEAVKANQPLSGTTGAGGAYLDALVMQYDALQAIMLSFDHISDHYRMFAIHAEEIASIDREREFLDDAAGARMIAAALHGAAAAASAIANASTDSEIGVASRVASCTAAGLHLAAAASDVAAIRFEKKAGDEQLEQKALHVRGMMVSELAQARDEAKLLSSEINKLIDGAAELEQVQKQAERAKAKMNHQDFVNGQPMYVNTVTRRTYNTNLLRYERALERARRLAFIARRAIELRFGVDMDYMAEPMTLVDAPQSWANEVCDMHGIDYSLIRKATDTGKPVEFSFGGVPPEGDHFAGEFVGDYVAKLDDFVTSYPFDYPLKDGDDVAVLSLAEDIWGLRATCAVPSRNLLYFSTDFGSMDSEQLHDQTRGWFIDGCAAGSTAIDGVQEPWRGCVRVLRESTMADLDDERADPVPLPEQQGLDLSGLPAGAVAYRVITEPCMDDGDELHCPPGSDTEPRGFVAQRLRDVTSGPHQASVYVHADPQSPPYPFDNGARVRVLADDDEEVASELVRPRGTWQRVEVPFMAAPGRTYFMVIEPSAEPVLAPVVHDSDVGRWPGLLVAAAQVEAVGQAGDGTIEPASKWERTGVERLSEDPVCHERVGPQLRQQFDRRCALVCPNGIKFECPGIDADTVPKVCFYEASFGIPLDQIESGQIIPSGQIAIGNFNFRHNLAGVNLVGTAITSCEDVPGASCYGNGFAEYTLIHGGDTQIRNWEGGSLPVLLDRAYIEHGKALANERTITNPPSSGDLSVLDSYMKGELKGRPIQGSYTIRIWESPSLRWQQVQDIQLVWRYHYWTRFEH